MKKILFLLVIFFNLLPYVHQGRLRLAGPIHTHAQYDEDGGDDGGDDGDPDDPGDPGDDPGDPGDDGGDPGDDGGDACDEGAAGYDPSACEEATCDPGSENYDVDECDEQACDETSVNYNSDDCEDETCLPDNVNYSAAECQAQTCDESSINYDASGCENATCDPNNVNYSQGECQAQTCDETSVNYDASGCEKATCDPSNVNYNKAECEAQTCDESSVNFDASACEKATCDPTNANYNKDECDAQTCDSSSVNYDASECERKTCQPGNVNYDASECQASHCDPTSVNYNPVICNCPCLGHLPDNATGGLLRNYNGDIIHAIGSTTTTAMDNGYLLTIRTDYVFAANGMPIDVQVVLSAVDASGHNNQTMVDNTTFNCLGWALGDGDYIIGAQNTTDINEILGISSISDAESNGTFHSDFANIQVGDVLLILTAGSGGYVHAAIYAGNGMYNTKNGMGDGSVGMETMTLAQIQAIYYASNMGGAVSFYVHPPSEGNSGSNLGIGTGGDTNLSAVGAAIGPDCNCAH